MVENIVGLSWSSLYFILLFVQAATCLCIHMQ
uniref:Uncharacterized protein n=1 Tax=Rhizophora mucronata TaxID=61149 RepID=A0A2P2PWQ3_RHIMU